ncbi:Uma2 family endonuclease [Trichothermofontia sichuanensis B231]|uniref:Uma2 family endonuclease n=1 Tax=Trichothermofontia sichuanensis TaxID=3045816 RepID=UPI0022476790|nr:Uma2 family endonuclease [Trichothermofontia sichuanensis]UZQ55589.1 Uma2 family endonuclease [Trichothermofontia sichuanensis B231]
MVLPQPPHSIVVPPLESGDRLTRAEFERRYQATPEKFKAELIEGVVYVASPVKVFHGTPHAALVGWLTVYWAATPGVSVADNSTLRLDMDNEPQPDALLRFETGGTSRISEDGYIEGAPELVAEIATSSAAIDLGAKKTVYRRNGVQEYLVWQTFENRFSWFRLQAEAFVLVEPDAEGIIRSTVFPGLWLAVDALLAGRMMAVLNVLQAGIADPAHQGFVQALAGRSA